MKPLSWLPIWVHFNDEDKLFSEVKGAFNMFNVIKYFRQDRHIEII